jgi:hypothetical protein
MKTRKGHLEGLTRCDRESHSAIVSSKLLPESLSLKLRRVKAKSDDSHVQPSISSGPPAWRQVCPLPAALAIKLESWELNPGINYYAINYYDGVDRFFSPRFAGAGD